MAHKFSNEEKFDMLAVYLQSHRNAEIAGTKYLELFPERSQPHKTYYRRIVTNLLNYGAFEQPREKYKMNNEDRDRTVLQAVRENPSAGVRRIGEQSNIPKSTVHKILKENKYHPYKPIIVQGLIDNDFERRMRFCDWYIQKCENELEFPNLVIWSDETQFTNCGVFNKHNHHYWSIENPRLLEQRRLQRRFGFNVWCGILGKCYFTDK